MKLDVTGKKELASMKFDWQLYQLDSSTTKCCAGGTRDVTGRHGVKKNRAKQAIPMDFDEKDARKIAATYGYLRS